MDRRRHYRAAADPVLEVVLVLPEVDGPIPCDIHDLTIAGALVRIPRDGSVTLALGDPLSLCITDTNTQVGVDLMATLVHCRTRSRSELLGLRFDDPMRAQALLDPTLVRLMNKRQNYRVPLHEATPVWVTLQSLDDSTVPLEQARLLDVATGGLGVEVSLGFERQLAHRDHLECMLFLPKTAMPIAVRGRVVHRALVGDRVRYGIALEEGEGPAAEDTHDVLLQYVLRRQRELVEDGVGQETLLRMLGSEPA